MVPARSCDLTPADAPGPAPTDGPLGPPNEGE
jgi:hypothetical protein